MTRNSVVATKLEAGFSRSQVSRPRWDRLDWLFLFCGRVRSFFIVFSCFEAWFALVVPAGWTACDGGAFMRDFARLRLLVNPTSVAWPGLDGYRPWMCPVAWLR